MSAQPDATPALAGAAGSALFKVGDAVTWTHCRSNGRSFQFTMRTGVVLEIGRTIALCKRHRAQPEWVRFDRLRHIGCRSELTDLVMAMATPLSPGVPPNDQAHPTAARASVGGTENL